MSRLTQLLLVVGLWGATACSGYPRRSSCEVMAERRVVARWDPAYTWSTERFGVMVDIGYFRGAEPAADAALREVTLILESRGIPGYVNGSLGVYCVAVPASRLGEACDLLSRDIPGFTVTACVR